MVPEGMKEEKAENSVFYKMYSLFRIVPEFEREINISPGYECQPEVVLECSDFEPDIQEMENPGKSCSSSEQDSDAEK